MTSRAPLQGRRVIVTRGIDKADPLPALLAAAGATVVRVPLIATERTAGAGGLRAALDRLREGHPATRPWLVLTSAIAVGLVVEAAGPDGLDGVAIAVVGRATDAALRPYGLHAELVASGQAGDSLAAELVARGVRGARALVVAAAGGRDVVATALSGAGALVEVLETYRSVIPPGAADRLREALAVSLPDAITFTSGSTVRHCSVALCGAPPPDIPAVCIGPVTESSARAAGWADVVTAAQPSAAGIVEAVVTRLAPAQPLP